MATCSIFKNLHKPVDKRSLILITKDIASGKYKVPVEKIRTLLDEGKTEEAQELKKQLPAFTPSAVFKNRRVKEEVEMYSGFVHLDFDKLTDEQLANAQTLLASDQHTYYSFISPGGRGLKVFVEVSSGIEDHEKAYLQVQDYYEKLTGLKADPCCKDVTRLCFMSYDPKLYKNLDNQKFPVKGLKSLRGLECLDSLEGTTQPSQCSLDIFNQQIQFTNRVKTYEEGSRNSYVYMLASNCNRAGLSEQSTLEFISKSFDLPVKEMQQTVKSAYKRSLGGLESLEDIRATTKSLNPSTTQPSLDETEEESNSVIMPTLPDDVFVTLPAFLKRVTSVANTKEERDILLLGSLTTISVALHQLTGKYRDVAVHSTLYLFVSAAASAGKGILIYCRKLVLPIHQRLREQTKLLKQLYDAELVEYRINKNKDASMEPPQKPPKRMLIIPGNNSATGFLQILNDSFQRGLIFETEGDTLAKTFNTDYGDFSDGFRKAFQHEPISYYRRTDEEYVEIDRPCLSVLLSGTPKQIRTLIPSTENGLFSRFMFYVMNMKYEWQNVFVSHSEKGLDRHFEQLGNEFYEFYQRLELRPEMTFALTNDQQVRFNSYFERIQNLYITIQEEDIISTVRRLGLTAFRIMMIFSALRLMESGEQTRVVVCEDVDFENTLKIISVLLEHSSHLFNQVVGEPEQLKPKTRREQFLLLLPGEFNRRTYLDIALKLKITDPTAQRYIKKFQKAGLIQSPYHDHYTKVQMEIIKKA